MKFSEAFPDQIRQRAPVRSDKWHLKKSSFRSPESHIGCGVR
jgi:hypothetical protein